jgi:hypothetical protein
MWRLWLEFHGMALCCSTLALAFVSALYGVYLMKNNPKRKKASSRVKAGTYLKAAGILAGFAILAAVGTAVAFERYQTAKESGPFPFGSGWVCCGYYHLVNKIFLTGPFAKIVARNADPMGDGNIPQKGDLLEVLQPTKVYIPYYQQTGLAHQYDAPITYKGRIEKTDETGVELKPGDRLEVKDMVSKCFTPNGTSIWVRVERVDSNAGGEGTALSQTPVEKK